MDALTDTLAALKAKWSEVPSASLRHDTPALLALGDSELLAYWKARRDEEIDRAWYQRLYPDILRGKRVLEIGSGMGFDALFFAAQGVEWHCADIAPDNLELIRRVAGAAGVALGGLHVVRDVESLNALPGQFDVIWANGSLHHIPFDLAVQECAALLDRLKAGGRWIELAYPYERWVREGAPAFDQWGKVTDGDRTPWAEWYDLEKLKQRLAPHAVETVLNFNWRSSAFTWFDVIKTGRLVDTSWTGCGIPAPGQVTTPDGLWHYAEVIDLSQMLAGAPEIISADLECVVTQGSIGVGFVNAGGSSYIGTERILDVGPRRRVTLTGPAKDVSSLVIRNASAGGKSEGEIGGIRLRAGL